MEIAYAPRASAILYNLLVKRVDRRKFLLPANICAIVPLTFLKAGVAFEFVDLSPDSLHMDLEAADRQLRSGHYGGLLYAHTYGEPSTPDDFFAAAKAADPTLLVIDDRCLCIPDFIPRHSPAPGADVSLYSTGYAKVVDQNIGSYAFFRGALLYQPCHLPYRPADLQVLEKASKHAILTNQPFVYTDSDWLQTDADLAPWKDFRSRAEATLEASLAYRQELNVIYTTRLPAELQFPAGYQTWRFNLHLPDRNGTLKAIFEGGLFASAHYASLAGIMAPGACPQAESLADQVINLFNDHHYTCEMAEKTCDIILKRLK
jgi:hypothetical protein